jgi:hypothetical protein
VKDFGDYLVAIVRGNVRHRENNGVTIREADNSPYANDVIIKIVPGTVISAQSSLRMTSTVGPTPSVRIATRSVVINDYSTRFDCFTRETLETRRTDDISRPSTR